MFYVRCPLEELELLITTLIRFTSSHNLNKCVSNQVLKKCYLVGFRQIKILHWKKTYLNQLKCNYTFKKSPIKQFIFKIRTVKGNVDILAHFSTFYLHIN